MTRRSVSAIHRQNERLFALRITRHELFFIGLLKVFFVGLSSGTTTAPWNRIDMMNMLYATLLFWIMASILTLRRIAVSPRIDGRLPSRNVWLMVSRGIIAACWATIALLAGGAYFDETLSLYSALSIIFGSCALACVLDKWIENRYPRIEARP